MTTPNRPRGPSGEVLHITLHPREPVHHKRFLSPPTKDNTLRIHSTTTAAEPQCLTSESLGQKYSSQHLRDSSGAAPHKNIFPNIIPVYIKKNNSSLFWVLNTENQLNQTDRPTWKICECNYRARLQVKQGPVFPVTVSFSLLFLVGGCPAVKRTQNGFSLEPICHWKLKKKKSKNQLAKGCHAPQGFTIIWCRQRMPQKALP